MSLSDSYTAAPLSLAITFPSYRFGYRLAISPQETAATTKAAKDKWKEAGRKARLAAEKAGADADAAEKARVAARDAAEARARGIEVDVGLREAAPEPEPAPTPAPAAGAGLHSH